MNEINIKIKINDNIQYSNEAQQDEKIDVIKKSLFQIMDFLEETKCNFKNAVIEDGLAEIELNFKK